MPKLTILICSFMFIGVSCKTNTSQLDKAKYDVINYVVNKAEKGWRKAPKPLTKMYMDSLFLGISDGKYSADPNRHDTIILNGLHKMFHRTDYLCKEAMPVLNLRKSGYVWSQLNKENTPIDFSRIESKNAVPYKRELENPESIAFLNEYKALEGTLLKGKKLVDSAYLESIKRRLLYKENGYFEISSPVFSKDKKTALIIVNYPSLGQGGYAWIVQKKKGEWEKVCDYNFWSY